jgi:hypothetical protein
MSNPLEAIGHGIQAGVKDVGKVVVKGVDVAIVHPIQFTLKAEKVIATAIKDQPVVRDAVVAMVKQATTVIDDFNTDVAGGFINLRADEKTLQDAEAFFNWFKSQFIPQMEQVYGDLEADAG